MRRTVFKRLLPGLFNSNGRMHTGTARDKADAGGIQAIADPEQRRLARRALFREPRFNCVDGLDDYCLMTPGEHIGAEGERNG
ncbi:MAG: hypothetical protein P8126_02445 [Gammaproteobacteria bacterium]|jgi:hypothetical protein